MKQKETKARKNFKCDCSIQCSSRQVSHVHKDSRADSKRQQTGDMMSCLPQSLQHKYLGPGGHAFLKQEHGRNFHTQTNYSKINEHKRHKNMLKPLRERTLITLKLLAGC